MVKPYEDQGEPALAPLVSRLRPVLSRRIGLALGLYGEAGIGKTYTVKELLSHTTCRTFSAHADTSLAALVRQLPRPPRLSGWANYRLDSLAQGEHSDMASSADALAALLAALSPIILHLEDLHEVSAQRLELWQHLAQRVSRIRGAALLVTSRTLPPDPFTPYRQEPLSPEASQALLEGQVTSELPSDATTWIYARAAGNPLFTLEYLRYLTRQGYLWNDHERWRWRAPEKVVMPVVVEALLEMRLLNLTDTELLSVLRSKALLGAEVSEAQWAEVAGLSLTSFLAARRELERIGLFINDTFAHPLYREVILKGLPADEQKVLARRAVAALDDPERAATFVKAAELDSAESLRLYRLAAEAARRLKHKGAVAHFLELAAEVAAGEARTKLTLEAAAALEGINYERMIVIAEKAAALMADPSEALYLKATALSVLGRYQEMEAVLALLPKEMTPLWLKRYTLLFHNTAHLPELLELWEAQPTLHESADGGTVYRVAMAYQRHGQAETASRLTLKALARSDLTTNHKADLLDMQAQLCFYRGDYRQAEAYYETALELGPDLFAQKRANLLRNRSVTRLQLGEYKHSLTDFAEALSIYTEVGNSLHYAQTLVMMSYVLLECGAYEHTEEILNEALALFRRVEPEPFYIHALGQLVELYSRWPAPAHAFLARKYADEALRIGQFVNDDYTSMVMALIQARVAPQAEALDKANAALACAQAFGNTPEALANSYCLQGLALEALGRDAEATLAFTQGCDLAANHGLVIEEHKIGLELARLQSDIAAAQVHLGWFESRGLTDGANLARKYFPDLGETAPQPSNDALPPAARLDVLGPMRVVRNGTAEPVRGQKRRELLARLLEARLAGRSEVSQLELSDVLYPETPETEAAATLKQLVFQTRKALGSELVMRTGSGYALGVVTSDAEIFLESGDTSLWRGVYLADMDTQDESVAEALYHALYLKLPVQLKTAPAETARLGRLLLETNPYDATVLSLTLQALQATHQHRALARLYTEARERFAEVGERLPENWRDFLGLSSAKVS